MAYALAVAGSDADGDGDAFDGPHAGGDARFLPRGRQRHDRTTACWPWHRAAVDRLQCGEATSTPATAIPTSPMRHDPGQAATDYVEVLWLAVRLAEPGRCRQREVIAASAGVTMAAAKSSIALSQTLLTAGAMAPVVAAAAFALAANTAAAVTAGVSLGLAQDALADARDMHQVAVAYRDAVLPVAHAIQARARQADAHGLH